MRSRAWVWISAVVALWLGCASGCGYTLGYRLPEGMRRVSVPQFANQTFPLRREIEFDLTRAVRQEIELRSDAVLATRSGADGILEGTVLSFREGVLTEGALDTVQESSVQVQVRIVLRTPDGNVLLDEIISDDVSFSTAAGESLEDARREAIDEIAERIVATLEAWE